MRLLRQRWADREGRLQLLFMLSRPGDDAISLGRLADMQGVTLRSIQARLTPKGRARIDSIRQPAVRLMFPLTEGFSDEELVQLCHLGLKLLANAQKPGKD